MRNFGKIFIIIFAVIFVAFLLAGGALFFFLRNFDLNKFKPQIVASMKQALGRDIELSSLALSVSLSQGISLNASGLKILDDPKFSNGPFLTVERLGLGVDILGFILKRQISISAVDIVSPHVFIIRNEDGVFNFQTLGIVQQANKNSEGQGSNSSSGVKKNFFMALAAILVQNIAVQNGSVNFKDDFEEERSLEGKKINFKISDFSLARPFKFSLQAACFSDKQNFSLSGLATIDARNATVILKNLQSKFDLAPVDVRFISGALPALSQARLTNPLAGQFEFVADEMRLSAKDFSIVKFKGQILGGEVSTAYFKEPVKNIAGKIEITNQDLSISGACGMIGNGRVDFNAVINDYRGAQNYKINLKVDGFNIKEALAPAKQDVSLEGLASFESTFEGQGLSDLSSFKPASGTTSVRLKQGKLMNINVLKIVLEKMSMIPDLVMNLEANLPEQYKEKLKQNDTELRVVNLDMNVQQGIFSINPAQIETDIFSVTGNGTMDFLLNTQMQAKISIPKDLSDSMIQAVPELKYLTDGEGCIGIPLSIEGKIPGQLRYLPDLEYLGRQLLKTVGRDEINTLLNKVLHKGDAEGSSGEAQPGSAGGNSGPTKEMINSVLDAIFKK